MRAGGHPDRHRDGRGDGDIHRATDHLLGHPPQARGVGVADQHGRYDFRDRSAGQFRFNVYLEQAGITAQLTTDKHRRAQQ